VSSQGRRPRPSSLSDVPRTPGFRAVPRGEPRIEPVCDAPVPVPPTCVGLPDRDTSKTALPILRRLASRRTSQRYRARVSGASEGRVLANETVVSPRVRALERTRRRSPPSSSRGHPLSSVRALAEEETCRERVRTDQDRDFVRPPAKKTGVTPIRVPFTVATQSAAAPDLSAPRVHLGLLPHAAHTLSPGLGTSASKGIASAATGNPCRGFEKAGRLCNPSESRLELTPQARQRGSTDAADRGS
jgi:hypothetical protein